MVDGLGSRRDRIVAERRSAAVVALDGGWLPQAVPQARLTQLLPSSTVAVVCRVNNGLGPSHPRCPGGHIEPVPAANSGGTREPLQYWIRVPDWCDQVGGAVACFRWLVMIEYTGVKVIGRLRWSVCRGRIAANADIPVAGTGDALAGGGLVNRDARHGDGLERVVQSHEVLLVLCILPPPTPT